MLQAWNFLGTVLFMGVGVKSLIVWVKAQAADDFTGTDQYWTNYTAGLALGSLCVVLSLTYCVDFFISSSARSRIRREQDDYYYGNRY